MKRSDIPPTILIVYGITGNAAKKKLLPALYELEVKRLLPEQLIIFGTSRRDLDKKDQLRLLSFKPSDPAAAKKLLSRLRTVHFDVASPDDYPRLASALKQFEQSRQKAYSIIHYLAVPPELYGTVITNLGKNRLDKPISADVPTRLVVEKPRGWSLAKTKTLSALIGKYFKEDQVFQLDRHLSKETIGNILTIRRCNPWLRELWSGKYIKEIHVKNFERGGVEWRSDFYEQSGELGDVISGRMLRILAALTMNIPAKLSPQALAKARTDLVRHIKPIRRKHIRGCLRGQYRSYRKEVSNPASAIETFVSLPLTIDRPTWRNTKIRLSAGKALERDETSAEIIFSDFGQGAECTNTLTLYLQPREGFALEFAIRGDGSHAKHEQTRLEHMYPDSTLFRTDYGPILFDILSGDRTIFPTQESIRATWRVIDPLLKHWRADKTQPSVYRAGIQAEKLLVELRG